MYGKKKTALSSLLTFIITSLVIILAVGVVFKYTKAGDKIKDLFNPAFRIEYDGKNYVSEINVIALPNKGQAQFKVKGAESYKVMLQPNVTPETDFTYEIGNTVYSYSQVDLSKVFEIGTKNGSFYINCLNDYSLESVLSKLHGGAKIKLNGNIEIPYKLTFTAANTAISFIFNGKLRVDLSEIKIVF